MKLSRIRILGRYTNPETNRAVNVHRGRRKARGTDHMFYVHSGRRVFINDADFYSNWKRV